MADREKERKYREAFNQSRAKVKDWEESFARENNRKPGKEDISRAPDKIQVCTRGLNKVNVPSTVSWKISQVCYKNCWKIKSYFGSKPKASQSVLPHDENASISYMEDSQVQK